MSLRPSSRVPWQLDESPFALAVEEAHRTGRTVLDLTISNPTEVGLRYPDDVVLAALAHPAALAYRPEPRGLPEARAAVAAYAADHGVRISSDDVLLTASTSEAYGWLFKILCEPGERVAIPRPSYPLFDFLATLEGVGTVSYALVRHGRWGIDLDSVREAIASGARAVLLVQPSNPVGAVVTADERTTLVGLCAEAGIALVVDEVFLDFVPGARTFAGEPGCLTLVLSGLSKVCALPQLKCGWIVASGPGARTALARLEVVADTFLSVNGPVQVALPSLLAGRAAVQDAIRARLAANRATLAASRPPEAPWDVVSDAGWYAVLRVPAVRTDEGWALALLEEGVVVHPGYFYDLPAAHLVVSLLPEPATFARGVDRIAHRSWA